MDNLDKVFLEGELERYKILYEKVCEINSSMNESLKIYHEQFIKDQKEIDNLKRALKFMTQKDI